MAAIETATPINGHDRAVRRRPFSNWMKKLANFKTSSSNTTNQNGFKRAPYSVKPQQKQDVQKHNSPYITSNQDQGRSAARVDNHASFSTVPTGRTASASSLDHSSHSYQSSEDGNGPATNENRSVIHSDSTEHEIALSEVAQSHAPSSGTGTMATLGGVPSVGRGVDSTFSSPAPSFRSLTTTLTTIQSAGAGGTGGTHLANPQNVSQITNGTNGNTGPSVQFTHQFPASPATAIPAHLQASGGHPATYNTATANNLLTDNASILTLASSSKRRRRRSMDTDASVRALAPSSIFGGSRESLPLSVLSSNIDPHTVSGTGMHQSRASIGGPAERASIYSSTGIAPALSSERNSFYAGKQNIMGDGGSIKSGLVGHGRNDSMSGSIGGIAVTNGLIASPREAPTAMGRISRANSAWETHENADAEIGMEKSG